MDALCASIKRIHAKVPVKYLLIGMSPSFYPVEYWKEGLNYLLHGLYRIGIDTQGIIHRIKTGD